MFEFSRLAESGEEKQRRFSPPGTRSFLGECWVLYLYGPQIREHLGTFRFLITELVPLQIILKGYRREENAVFSGTGLPELRGADFDPFLDTPS